jgi:hypothetical protein
MTSAVVRIYWLLQGPQMQTITRVSGRGVIRVGIISYVVILMHKLRIGFTVFTGNDSIADRKQESAFIEMD